jgi:Fe-S cluster assembly iron-binding protein IscA
LSNFKLTLDELKDGDFETEANGLKIFYQKDVQPHLHRLHISYENGRLGLKDKNNV